MNLARLLPIGAGLALLIHVPAVASGLFEGRQALEPVSPAPYAFATADLDQDGNLDLVICGRFETTVSLLFGRGDGTFRPERILNVPDGTEGLAIADLNRDGHPDLVVRTGRSFQTFLGRGDGGFDAGALVAAGEGIDLPETFAIADLDEDGRPDLAEVYPGPALLRVYHGDGVGGFGTPHDSPVGQAPVAVVVADMNGDHHLDLLVGDIHNDDTGGVHVLLGAGDGSFGAPTEFAVPTLCVTLEVADFDGDGHPDVVTAALGTSQTLHLLPGTGDGRLGAPEEVARGWDAIAADMDGDDRVDLVVRSFESAIVLYGGHGDGTFAPPSASSSGTARSSVMAVGDFTNDGRPDVVVGDDCERAIACVVQRADGSIGFRRDFAVAGLPAKLVAVDLNSDGHADLATANYQSGMSLLLGHGDGGFDPAIAISAGRYPSGIVAADLNGDGHPDLAISNSRDRTVSVLLGDGAGQLPSRTDYAVNGAPGGLAVGDVNEDGRPDLVVALEVTGSPSGLVSVLLGNGDGTFGPPTDRAAGGWTLSVALADLDDDGHLDVVAGNGLGASSVLLGRGDGSFEPFAAIPGTEHSSPGIAIADLDHDGHPDLALLAFGAVRVLLGNGDGTFSLTTLDVPTFACGGNLSAISAGDFDGDGSPDLMIASASASMCEVFPGDGHGGFRPPERILVGPGPSDLAVGDFNGDGLPDLATANVLEGGSVSVRLNLGEIKNAPPVTAGAHASISNGGLAEHRLEPVTIEGVVDPDGDAVTIEVTGVTQDEPVNGHGDGDTCPDAVIVDGAARVRRERDGAGNGRVYAITFVARDARGGASGGTVTVCVPHDRGGDSCVDDGQRYASVAECGSAPAAAEAPGTGRPGLRGAVGPSRRAALEYTLPVDGRAELGLFDVSGRRVAALVDEAQRVGAHRVEWDGAGLRQGVYFAQLRLDGVAIARTTLVMR